jgi:hypothetical protein
MGVTEGKAERIFQAPSAFFLLLSWFLMWSSKSWRGKIGDCKSAVPAPVVSLTTGWPALVD